jgi:hypothetical protein
MGIRGGFCEVAMRSIIATGGLQPQRNRQIFLAHPRFTPTDQRPSIA